MVGSPVGSVVGNVVGSAVVGAAVGSSVGGMHPHPQLGVYHVIICIEVHCNPLPCWSSAQYVAQMESSSKYMSAPNGAHEVSIVGRGVVGPGLGGWVGGWLSVGDGLKLQKSAQSTFNAVGAH